MSLAIPVTNGHMSGDALTFAGGMGVGSYELPGVSSAQGVGAGASAAAIQGTGSLAAPHNTPLHVASILLIAGGIVIALHYMGFRFGFDVGAGR